MIKRTLTPETLDQLPEEDPDAIASRRDLRLINRIMGNERWIIRQLKTRAKPDDQILEIGAGTGNLGKIISQKYPKLISGYSGLDLQPRPIDWPKKWNWIQKDLTDFKTFNRFSILIANLILHHFDDQTLRKIGKLLTSSNIKLIIANETARHRIHQWQLQLLRPLKINQVTLHDGFVSIEAGFRKNELPDLLDLQNSDWQIQTSRTLFGAYRMIALRSEIL